MYLAASEQRITVFGLDTMIPCQADIIIFRKYLANQIEENRAEIGNDTMSSQNCAITIKFC